MTSLFKSTTIALLLTATVALSAQTTTEKTKKHKEKKPTVEQQIQALHNDMQAQIDALKAQLAAKDAQVVALQQTTQATSDAQATTAAKVQILDTNTAQVSSSLTSVQATATKAETQSDATAEQVKTVDANVHKLEHEVNEPLAIHYKGLTLTPGGFLAAESVWRQRAMVSDIYTPFNFTPYMNSGQAHLSEWVPTARQSRVFVKGTGKVPFGTVTGYVEGDFLSAGITSNSVQSNSYTLRLRQAWGQLAWGNMKFTGGQTFTLATENKIAADPGQEALPINIDNNFHVGFTYVRQPGFRIEDSFSKKFTLAMSLEASQTQFSASNALANFVIGGTGLVNGLNNTTANYTDQVSPDVIIKASFDPGYGHYEIGGMARFFRDRYYPTVGSSAGAQNDTRVGGGVIASARFSVKTLDIGLHAVAGDGTGRYGASILPDVTVRPDGTLTLIRNFQGLLSLEEHATKKLDIYGYAGDEYVQRTIHATSAGVQVGYAPITGNNTGCNVEVVPGAGGYAPGVSATCLGATRNLVQGTLGFTYRIYTGPAGRLQFGSAYSYLTREAWRGVGATPKGTNNMVYTSFRYYLP